MTTPYRTITAVIIAFILLVAFASAVQAKAPVFVTICHAAGRADAPANWVTLTLPEQAVYGQAGHFNENGTTQAGHEQDYMGACQVAATPTPTPAAETPTPTPVIEATPTPVPSESPVVTPSQSIDVPATTTPQPQIPNTAYTGDFGEVDGVILFTLLGGLLIAGAMWLFLRGKNQTENWVEDMDRNYDGPDSE